MTRTDHLHLCTWTGSDPVSMEEMNENFRTLDIVGGQGKSLFEPLLWNSAGAMLDAMEAGASGQYIEGILADALKDRRHIAAYSQLFFDGSSAKSLGLQSMTRCGFTGTTSSDLVTTASKTGCRYIEHISSYAGTDYPEIVRFTPFNYYQTSGITVTRNRATCTDQYVQLKDDAGNLLWSGTVSGTLPIGTRTISDATASVSVLLDPNQVYHLFAAAADGSSTEIQAAYFHGTEVLYENGGTFRTAAQTIPVGAARARVMVRCVSPADVSAKLVTGSSQITMQKSAAEDDSVNDAACKLVRFSCALPEGCEQAAVEVALGSAAAQIIDYAMILV